MNSLTGAGVIHIECSVVHHAIDLDNLSTTSVATAATATLATVADKRDITDVCRTPNGTKHLCERGV